MVMKELMNMLCKIQAELFEAECMAGALAKRQKKGSNAEIEITNSMASISSAFSNVISAIYDVRNANREPHDE